MAVIGHFSTMVNAQMKVDANLRDDGMEYIQTLTIVQRNIQMYLFRHARKSRVMLICTHSYDANITDYYLC